MSATPAWVVMWSLAAAIYFLCKLWTLRFTCTRGVRPSTAAALAYLFLWLGINAAGFLEPRTAYQTRRNWLAPLAKAALGARLLWGVARCAAPPLLAGWFGMVGLILLLHFGLFELVALAWQQMGREAPPLMQQPLRATSLSDFWGR